MQNVAEYVARTLGATGVEVVFGYPGQSNLQLLKACRSVGMRYVQTADERSAAFAAAGYAESSGAPAFVCASKGPAATNLLTSTDRRTWTACRCWRSRATSPRSTGAGTAFRSSTPRRSSWPRAR